MQFERPDNTIYAKECYDWSYLGNELKPKKFCPFDIPSGKYAWIDE